MQHAAYNEHMWKRHRLASRARSVVLASPLALVVTLTGCPTEDTVSSYRPDIDAGADVLDSRVPDAAPDGPAADSIADVTDASDATVIDAPDAKDATVVDAIDANDANDAIDANDATVVDAADANDA